MTTATAHSNIALVKYWGKRDSRLNLPATPSLSLTLDALTTTTSVVDADVDLVCLDGSPAAAPFARRVLAFLDLLGSELGVPRQPVRVETRNDFPTAAGLASSASGFAALTMAASRHFGATSTLDQLSGLARQGSGSAARSLHGGWVEMAVGARDDGTDAVASQIAAADHWDLRCLVLITVRGEKATGSTDGMSLTATSSPYYDAWVQGVPSDLSQARDAVLRRDFEQLAVVAERSCMRMHASAIAADPAVLYWNGATVELIHRVRALRAAGHAAFFTIDAGPHLKVFCPPEVVAVVRDAADDAIIDSIVSKPGGPARIVAT